MFVSAKFFAATTAQVVYCPSGFKPVITGAYIYLDGAVTVNVAVNLGFGQNTLDRVATGHPGIVPGSGFTEKRHCEGNKAEHIYFSCGAPTTGSVQLNLDYEIHPLNN